MTAPLRIVSGMMDENHISIILEQLRTVINNDIPGDVVELGCNVGTTSVYIQNELKDMDRNFHVYDSFQGLPERHHKDGLTEYEAGSCPSTIMQFKNHFKEFDLPLPIVHTGWFKNQNYPPQVAFAFFDGDFYTSIIDSWEAVYDRLPPGAIVCIHDYDWLPLPGVKNACDDFLKGKPEEGTIQFSNYIGIFTKL